MEIIAKEFCPYCERVDIAIKLRKIPLETMHIEKITDGNFPEDLVSINPNKTFPTLVITSTTGFSESMIILEYLDSIDASGTKLYGNSPENIAKTKFNIEILENKVTSIIKKYSYTLGSITEERKIIERLPQAFEALGNLLENKGSRFFGGDELNAEDIQIAPFIARYLATKIYRNYLPSTTNSRAEKYFNDIMHHSIIRKCIPNLEDLALILKKYNEIKGLNFDIIKNSSRQIILNKTEKLNELNSKLKNIEWKIGKNDKGNYIHTQFNFKNTNDALNALNLLNEIQEATNHHTTFNLHNFSALKIELCTHQPKYGVTEMDLAFAEVLTNKICSI